MHAAPPAPDIAAQFAAELQHAQRDALQTLHKVMLHLTSSLTKSAEEEETPRARTATQRIRLCLRAAIEILRVRHPSDASAPRDAQPSTRLRRKPGPTEPQDNPTAPAHANTSPNTDAAQPANKLLAAAGHAVSRFGERIGAPHDSGLSTHNPSPPTRDSSLVAHTSPPPPPPPPRPEYFSDQERKEMFAVLDNKQGRFPPHLYARILEWNRYAAAAELSPAFGIKQHDLEARKPLEPIHSPAAPPG